MKAVHFNILDVFRLRDSTTVLAGELDRELLPRVERCQAHLCVNGELRQKLEIDGETTLEGAPMGNHRGLSTRQDVEVSQEEVAKKVCVLQLM